MMEKLGVEKTELIAELQTEYNRKKAQQHELQKTGAPGPRRAEAIKELENIRYRLDELQKR